MARRCIDGVRGSVVAAAAAAIVLAASGAAAAQQCRGHVYLTLDTGNMSQAEEIAAILRRQVVRRRVLARCVTLGSTGTRG